MQLDQLPQLLLTFVYAVLLSILILVTVSAGIAATFFALALWKKSKIRQKKSLSSVLIEIQLPRDNEIKIDAAEQMFSSFASLKGASGKLAFMKVPDSISFEIVAKPGDIRFYVEVPKKYQDMVEKQINGAYPDAEITEVPEYNLFEGDGKVAFAGLKLKGSPYDPIKSYKDLAVDPLSTITSALSKMQDGEAAAIQIIISPADGKWKKSGRSFISSTKKREANPETAKYSVDQKELEAVDQKIARVAFNTWIRIVVSSSTKEAADAHITNMAGAFSQFAGYNSFTKEKLKYFKGMFMIDFIYRYVPLLNKGSVLSIDELASIFHLPNKSIANPNIHWLKARSAPASPLLPLEGLFLGKSKYRGVTRPVHLALDDRRRHMYIIGKTGTGKSVFLQSMILQDIREGKGVAVIDPHGELIDDVLPMIPPERAEDVIYFDPSETERPMGINMLAAETEEQMHFMVNSIIGLMYKLFDPNKTGIIGPRFEHAVRNAMLTVMVEPGNTLIEVMRVLTDESFVQELLPKLKDPIVRRYWTDQVAKTSDFHKSEVLDYITSKFGRFVTNTMMRNIIGQSDSAFNFRKVMDEGKILLINLAKGKIGEENSNFLGLVLVPQLLIAAMSRQNIPLEERKDFFLYVDEFQNFATPDFAAILSEARKYRLSLTVANQFIGQMDEEIKNAIFGNVGTIASFRVGVTDANYLAHEFQPVFGEGDLVNIEARHAYVRTIVNNEPVPPFSLDLNRDLTAEKKLSSPRVAELVKELSKLKYGKPKQLVEAEIARRSRFYEVFGDAGVEAPEIAPPRDGGKLDGGMGGSV